MNFYDQLQHATLDDRANLQSIPIIASAIEGRVTREHYLRFLTRAFHHVKHTPSLLMACGARLDDRRDWLRAEVAHYIDEEIGHHDWVLNDIAAIGGDVESVRHAAADFDTSVMVSVAYDTVTRGNPVGLFGMVYVLEGTSVSLACSVAAALQKALGLPQNAFTYLRSHGTLDVAHTDHFAQLVNRLDCSADREAVISGAKAFFRLYGNVLRSVEPAVAA